MSLLDPTTELDLKDKRAIEASLRVPGWWDGLPENTRRAVMNKLLAALAKAESARDIGSLTRSLIAADRLDLEREKLERGQAQPGVVNNTQNVLIGIPGGLAALTIDQLRALVADGQ